MNKPLKHPPALVLLPRDFDQMTANMSAEDKETLRKKYVSEFMASRNQLISWVRRDKDSRMKGEYTKAIAIFAIERTNFETGQCNPSYQFIADEIGCSVRTVERDMPRIEEAGWCRSIRVSRTMSKFYVWTAPDHKVKFLDEDKAAKEQARENARLERKNRFHKKLDPTDVSARPQFEPTDVSGHEPTREAGREPTDVSGKHINEHHNGNTQFDGISEGREGTYTHARTRETPIPSNPSVFGVWVRLNIPDPRNHNEAMSLLRAGKMTLEELRRLSA